MLISKNIVIAGRQFQPQLVGEYWLIKNEVIPETAAGGNKVSSEVFAAFSTTMCDVVVLPDKITITGKPNGLDTEMALLAEKLILKLPNPGYIGVGLNSQWSVPLGDDPSKYQQSFRPPGKLPSQLNKSDAKWGSLAYLNSIHGSILRFQVLPIFENGSSSSRFTGLMTDFNFHFDATEANDPAKKCLDALPFLKNTTDLAAQITAELIEQPS